MGAAIFGASKFGEAALSHLKNDFDICCFCDNSKEKQGGKFCGYDVISPHQLSGKDVIVASYYSLEIIEQLLSMGIRDFYVAFDNGFGKIEASFIKLSQFENLSRINSKVCLVCENNSGSNTLAMSKLMRSSAYEVVLINELRKDTDYYYHLFTSGVIFRTHAGSTLEGAINIQLWHGIGLKPLGYMDRGASMSINEPKHKAWLKFDAVFSYSQMYNLILSACYGVPENKFYITGAPRNDFLFNTDGRRLLSEIMDIDVTRRLILYAPTFRKNVYGFKTGSDKAYLYDMDGVNLREFDDFLEKFNYLMIMKFHPRDTEEAGEKLVGLKNIKLLTDDILYKGNLDFYEVLNAFDCLISDYSSLASDFLLLDRPLVYMPLDFDEYEKTVGFLLEPYDFWCPGEKVYDYETLKQKLKTIFIEDNYGAERKLVRSIFHKHIDGESTKRTFEALGQMLSGERGRST